MQSPFGGWRHHLSPASGGTITRAYCRAAYEENVSRCFILSPGWGKVRRSRIGGGERSEPIRKMLIMPYDTARSSRNADFISIAAERQSATLGAKGPSTLTPDRACPRPFTHNKKSAKLLFSGFHGDPRGIRTPDTLIRSQVLYPAELLGQIGRGRGTQTPNLRFWRPLLYQLRYAPRRMFLATVLS